MWFYYSGVDTGRAIIQDANFVSTMYIYLFIDTMAEKRDILGAHLVIILLSTRCSSLKTLNPTGPNFMALLTAEFCDYDHDSRLRASAEFLCLPKRRVPCNVEYACKHRIPCFRKRRFWVFGKQIHAIWPWSFVRLRLAYLTICADMFYGLHTHTQHYLILIWLKNRCYSFRIDMGACVRSWQLFPLICNVCLLSSCSFFLGITCFPAITLYVFPYQHCICSSLLKALSPFPRLTHHNCRLPPNTHS